MATPTNPADFSPILVGVTPAGCEWIAYRPDAVKPMAERLAALQARHAAKQAHHAAKRPKADDMSGAAMRRVKLTTETQHELLVRFLADDSSAILRKTFIETTEKELEELADLIEGEIEDAMNSAADSAMAAKTDQEVAFAAIAGGMSCAILAARLRGKRINKGAVRKQLSREWS